MSSLLITGGAGFIGANFVHFWLTTHPGDTLTVLDSLTYAGNLESLDGAIDKPQVRFEQGDICDTELVARLLTDRSVDTIVHFAAESHVDRSISGPDGFIQTNVVGTHSLLKAARSVWLGKRPLANHRFHHVSTDEVYGSLGADDPPFTEASVYAPNSPYSASKAGSDHLVRAYCHTYGLQVTTTNCSNNYGPFQFPEKLIPLLIANLLDGRPLPIYGNGQQVRDWLHVEDHCRGVELVLRSGQTGETYNIGARSERRNIEIAYALCDIADEAFRSTPGLKSRFPQSPASQGRPTSSLISFVPDRPGHDRRYAIDARKIENELGFTATRTLETGLSATFQWYIENESWWRRVTERVTQDRSATDHP